MGWVMTFAPKLSPERLELLARKAATVIEIAAATASPGWSSPVLLPRHFFVSKVEQGLVIGLCPTRATEPDELVKFDLNLDGGFAAPEGFIDLLLGQIGEFID